MIVRYSVIRFMPFAETQEFANIGILAHSPDTGIVDFKLATGKNRRVSAFFDDMDGALYTKAIAVFKTELNRVKKDAFGLSGKALAFFMNEVTRPREGFLTFSETSTMLSNENMEAVLDRLYEVYVARTFVTKEHKETVLLKMVREKVNTASGKLFRKDRLGSGTIEFELPLVAKTHAYTKAIKPLAFYQNDPVSLFDHGQFWIQRINFLLTTNILIPSNFLFVVDKPKGIRDELIDAYNLIDKQMKTLDVRIHDVAEHLAIAEFARDQMDNSLDGHTYHH